MEELILNQPRHLFVNRLAVWLNTIPEDNPLKEKARRTFAWLCAREREELEKRIAGMCWLNSTREKLST